MFALIRHDTENYRPPNGDWESAFINFRDLDLQQRGESAFFTDTKRALQPIIEGKEEGAPSFQVFRKALVEGRLFGIVTARGHQPKSIRKAVEYVIDNVLTHEERSQMMASLRAYRVAFNEETDPPADDETVLDRYLSLNKYHGVTSPEFKGGILAKEGADAGAERPEEAKQLAIKDFVDHVLAIANSGRIDKRIKVGFSDDDAKNLEAARSYIEDFIAKEYPYVSFVVYDTSAPKNRGKKTVLQGQLELGLE